MTASGTTPELLQYKSERKAILLAAVVGVFLMGFGHFYMTRFKRGILVLILGIVTGIIFFVAVFGGFFSESFTIAAAFGSMRLALWMWQIYDAHKLANVYNEKLKDTGRPPW
jgi:TM2 domain-containing membrane protein YozV